MAETQKAVSAAAPKATGKSIRIKLPPALGSYVNIFTPRSAQAGQDPKYSISLLWDKNEAAKSLVPLKQAITEVAKQKFGPKAIELIKAGKIRIPVRDGDTDRPDDAVYAGKVFANASSKNIPGCVDAACQPIMADDEAYSGCIFRASVNVYAYDTAGNKGVALGLNNLQVVKQGERIDGRMKAEDDFAEFKDESGGGGESEAAANDFLT
jgi:hypothetical protein